MTTSGKARNPMKTITIRMSEDLLERLDWLAEEKSINRAELIRMVMAQVSKDAKPPTRRKDRKLDVTRREWEQWADAAEHLGENRNELIVKVMNKLVKNVFNQAKQGEKDDK